MKSTFSVIYYLKRQVVKKDGTVPVMGRITVDGSQTQFSCKLTIDPKLWDTKGSQLDDEELKRRLLEHVNRYGFITRTTYTELTGRLKNKALEDLKRFAKEGIICKVGRGNQMLFVKNQEDSQTEQNI